MICNAIDKLKCSRRAALRAVACRSVQPTIHILIMKLDCIHIDVEQYQQWSVKYKLLYINPSFLIPMDHCIACLNSWSWRWLGCFILLCNNWFKWSCWVLNKVPWIHLLVQDVSFVVFAGTRLSQVNVKAVENTLLWIRWERKELRKFWVSGKTKTTVSSNQKHKKVRKKSRNRDLPKIFND